MDVDVEIYIPRNFGSVSVAKEYVRAQSHSFAAIERDPQRFILMPNESPKSRFAEAPSPQSSPRRRGEAEQSRE